MVTLKEVFAHLGYTSEPQHTALVKLLAYRNCFETLNFNNVLINDDEAKKLLSMEFEALDIGIQWIKDATQKNWLRTTFSLEGIKEGTNPFVNLDRWNLLNDTVPSVEYQNWLDIFRALDFIDECPWPQTPVENVIIHGGLEPQLVARMNFIQPFEGRLFYMTNARGLFNHEPSLPSILANLFGKPEYEQKIAEALKTSKKSWLVDLPGLKTEILMAVNEDSWPTDKGWYYKDREIFDSAADADNKRAHLDGWPTVMDLVEYKFKELQSKYPGQFDNVSLIPIYSIRAGRVANTADNFEDLAQKYPEVLALNAPTVCVSNNSGGLHYIEFQNEILKRQRKGQDDIKTVGDKGDKISVPAACDALAKIIFERSKELELRLQKQRTNRVSDSSMFSGRPSESTVSPQPFALN